MRKNKNWTSVALGVLAGAALVLGCVTVNVYFPESKVKDLSEQIEEAIARKAAAETDVQSSTENSENSGENGKDGLTSHLNSLLGHMIHQLGPAPVFADENDVVAPEISSPAIRRIINSRSARVDEINRFKSDGALGEGRDALLVVRSLDALPLAERAAVQRLVKQENKDREEMFKEIAAATGVDLSQLPRIQETYAATLRAKARSGDWIEKPDGTWVQK